MINEAEVFKVGDRVLAYFSPGAPEGTVIAIASGYYGAKYKVKFRIFKKWYDGMDLFKLKD